MFKFLKEKLSTIFKKDEEKPKKQVKSKKKTKITRKEKLEKKVKENIEVPEEKIEEVSQEKGFWTKIKDKFKFKIEEEDFNEIFSDLEYILLENNVAFEVEEKIKEELKKQLLGKEIKKQDLENEIKIALKNSISSILIEPFDLIEKIKSKEGTFVILFFGINGSGKTTTIAKVANLLKKNNISCVLAAADTFRAASIEQISEHASRLNIQVIKSQYNADPASVAFDAIKHASSRKIKAVLIDTAGRMHTKDSLMREMEKIARISNPDLKIFIAESITGNDAIEQAKIFNETIGIDGIILSKADVDEKGGTPLSVSYITKKPILFLGTGQEYKDLEKFNKDKIIKNLGL